MNPPYVSIDIETTGLNPEVCQILEIGAVYENWETPVDQLEVFNCYVKNTPVIGEPYALSMPHNVEILRTIATGKTGVPIMLPNQAAGAFRLWLIGLGYARTGAFTPAGKNFGSFDLQFLKKLPGWDTGVRVRHRAINPGMLYWEPNDLTVPDMLTCMKRAGRGGIVTHEAVEDALEVIRLVRIKHKVLI